ncbi:uncharacterized protein [Diadema antillarum]|uniref:uncharacterized protein isoform X1 n=1 Tax=Diadema antillarum TaxID=105358 RepID=UPI003A857AB3
MAALIKGASACFPFLCALTLIKLGWEPEQGHDYFRKGREAYPWFHIYIFPPYVVALTVFGTVALCYSSRRSQIAIVTAILMTVKTIYTAVTQSQHSSSNKWMVVRVAFHDVGAIGGILIMAKCVAENPSGNYWLSLLQYTRRVIEKYSVLTWLSHIGRKLAFDTVEMILDWMKRIGLDLLYHYGKNLISIFCIFSAVQLYTVDEERRAFLDVWPNQVAMGTLGISLLLGGFLLLSEWQTRLISGLVAGALLLYFITIDCNIHYWQSRLHVKYWQQMNIILKSAYVIFTLISIALEGI